MIFNAILSGPVLEPRSRLTSESLLWTWRGLHLHTSKNFSAVLETGCAPSVSPLLDSVIATFLTYHCQAFQPELTDSNEKLQMTLRKNYEIMSIRPKLAHQEKEWRTFAKRAKETCSKPLLPRLQNGSNLLPQRERASLFFCSVSLHSAK